MTISKLRLLYPVERLCLLVVLLLPVLYLIAGRFQRLTENYTGLLVHYSEALRTIALLYPFSLLIAYLVLMLRQGVKAKAAGVKLSEAELWSEYKQHFFSVILIVRHLRLLHAVSVLLVCFLLLKHLVPDLNSSLYDSLLLELDKFLLGENLLALSGPAWVVELLSGSYLLFYAYLSLLVFFFAIQPDNALAQQFCLAYGLLWIAGVLWVYLMPTWGPCFFAPNIYSSMPDSEMRSMQQLLWFNKTVLEQDPWAKEALFSISGLPSLHFALTVLGTYYLCFVSKVLFFFSSVFALLTMLATLVFGWHYLADDFASVLLVLFCVWLAKSFIPLGLKQETQ